MKRVRFDPRTKEPYDSKRCALCWTSDIGIYDKRRQAYVRRDFDTCSSCHRSHCFHCMKSTKCLTCSENPER